MWIKANRIDQIRYTIFHKYQKTKSKEILGMQVAYRCVGKGAMTVFCIPGWPSSGSEFLPLALAIKNHLRIITIDLPGWGGYSDKMILDPSIENYTKVVEGFIKSFKTKNFAIIAYSFGGIITESIVDNRKLKPKKVILLSAMHSGKNLLKRYKVLLTLYKLTSKSGLTRFIAKKYLIRVLFGLIKKTYPKEYKRSKIIDLYIKEILKLNIESSFGVLFSILGEDWIQKYKKSTETLIVYADGDLEFIKNECQEIANFLGIEPVVIENANHNHFAFDVNKSADIILNFLLA